MQPTYYNPKVRFLLLNQPVGDVEMLYADRKERFSVPLIGPRPPYYIHPVYAPYYSVI